MKIEEIGIDKVIPYENNPRNNDSAVEAVAASIREFGFRVPVVIDADNVLVTGHTRLRAAEMLGMKKIPVIKASDLTEEQIREFRIIDNKSSELADWDLEVMRKELESIQGIDMTEFGFMIEEIEEQKRKEAETEEKEKKEHKKMAVKEICCPRCGRIVSVE
jgi:site-specific DNA-methyltransferase (adenine-specific)